jgi:hypothetical protein
MTTMMKQQHTAFFGSNHTPAAGPEAVEPAATFAASFAASFAATSKPRGVILPMVWATTAPSAELDRLTCKSASLSTLSPARSPARSSGSKLLTMVVAQPSPAATKPTPAAETPEAPVALELAFYRKYTEALLRRYVKMSMEAGRAPSLLGREMFRGRVTSYRVHSFEDSVIFIHDIEKCIAKLDRPQQQILYRIAQQEYTLIETAALLAVPLRTVLRRYGRALDTLTQHLLAHRLLEPLKSCQGV